MADHSKSFAEFVEGWELQNLSYLEKLLAVQNDIENCDEDSLRHLVEQVVDHHQRFFHEKSKAAETDVFLMFSPPWITSFERTLFWATGFKPSLIFRLVSETVGDDLSEDQRQKISAVREETRRMEAEIELAMASFQESVAAPPFYGLVKREAILVDGEMSDMENAVEGLKTAMKGLMRDADFLRQKAAGDVLEILVPAQRVKFLAGISSFFVQSRRVGIERANK